MAEIVYCSSYENERPIQQNLKANMAVLNVTNSLIVPSGFFQKEDP